METLALRGHLAWPLGRGAPLDLPALPGSLESLVFPGSQAGLGVWERQEGQERGENGERKENVENRAEMALLASLDPLGSLDPLAPRCLWMGQVLHSLENRDPLDSRVLRESQAAMVTEVPKETGVCQASKETGESLDRGARMATWVYRESVVWLGLKGSRVCRVQEDPLAQWVVMETLDHLVPRVLLALQDPRDPLA